MAHIGDELRFVLAGDLKFPALAGDLLEQARILKRNRRLIGKALHQAHDRGRKLACTVALQNQCAKGTLASEERDDKGSTQTGLNCGIPQWVACPRGGIWNLQRFTPRDRLAQTCPCCSDVEF